MSTKLFLQEIPTNDCRILTFCDSSFYNPDIDTTNAILEITPPGFDCAVFFELKPKFTITLNSSNLKILPAKTQSQLVCLPDGIYKIRYSVNPNTKLAVDYDFLRNTQQMAAYFRAVCNLFEKRDKITKLLFEQRRAQLVWIRDLIFGAKYKTEECGDCEAGINMYNEANRLLVDFNNCTTC
jgi:hypothetical protein